MSYNVYIGSTVNGPQRHPPFGSGQPGPSNPGPSNPGPSTSNTGSTNHLGSQSNPPLSAAAEQRRLFNFGNRVSSANMSGKQKAAKRRKLPTCTLKFCCLSSKDADRPPSSVKERTELSNAGLGECNISFPQNGVPVYDKLTERFPQLNEAGGFDMLLYQRGGGEDSGFHVIKPPHTPSHLKNLCGQAKIYVRPVQQDLKLNVEAGTLLPIEVECIMFCN